MSLFKSLFKVIKFWLILSLSLLFIITLFYICLFILGIENEKTIFELWSDFYVTGKISDISMWRVHFLVIFLGTFFSLLNKMFPDDDFDTYS